MKKPKGSSQRERGSRRPAEQEAVRTTIVGGRPPGSGKSVGPIPRGIEVLVKKAAVDPEFKELLLRERAGAAEAIELQLDPSEVVMLNGVPEAQLEAIIARTTIAPKNRPAFLGRAAVTMLAALGVGAGQGCDGCRDWGTMGVRPDDIREGEQVESPAVPETPKPPNEVTKGIRPDRPKSEEQPKEPITRGIRPDRPARREPSEGIRPDHPESDEAE